MNNVIPFKPRTRLPKPTVDARIEYMYAPEVDSDYPFAFRVVCENPEAGVWLSREEYISLLADLVDTLTEESL